MSATRILRRPLLILTTAWLLLYASWTLFTPPLMDDADSVHAEASREILLRHDWVTLHADGIRYLEKAPLLYWSMAASMRVFGVHDWAARLPLALAMFALMLAVYAFGRRAFGERAALYAALLLALSPGCFLYTRFLIPDVLVCLWTTLALYAFWRSEEFEAPPLRFPLIFAAACALNVLTKGLIGLLFPIGVSLLALLITRGLRGTLHRIRAFHPTLATLCFLAIAAPWHILAALRNPSQGHLPGINFHHWPWIVPVPTQGNVHGWLWFYFVNEHLLRYLNLRVPRDYDTVPLWLFWLLAIVWLFPWSAWLCASLRNRIHIDPATRRTTLLLVLWAAAILVFFSFSTRQEYYSLPALPALALLIGRQLSTEDDATPNTPSRRSGLRISLILAILLVPIALITALIALFVHAPAGSDLASLLAQNPGNYALSLGHVLDLNLRALSLFRLPLALTAIAFSFGPFANYIARRRSRPAAGNACLFVMMAVFLAAVHLAFATFNPILGSKPLANAIAAQHPTPADLIVIHGEFESGSTLSFYLQRDDVHLLDGRSSNLWYGSFFPDAPPRFETASSIAAAWNSPARVFLWHDPSDATRPLPSLSPVFVIASSGGKQILSNQPAR